MEFPRLRDRAHLRYQRNRACQSKAQDFLRLPVLGELWTDDYRRAPENLSRSGSDSARDRNSQPGYQRVRCRHFLDRDIPIGPAADILDA